MISQQRGQEFKGELGEVRPLDYKGWIALVGIPVVFFVLYLYDYIPGHNFSLCAIKYTTGVDCPGCHITRSLSYFARGDIALAFESHILGPFVAVFGIYLFARALVWLFLGLYPGELLDRKMRYRVSVIFVAFLFLQWIARLLRQITGPS